VAGNAEAGGEAAEGLVAACMGGSDAEAGVIPSAEDSPAAGIAAAGEAAAACCGKPGWDDGDGFHCEAVGEGVAWPGREA